MSYKFSLDQQIEEVDRELKLRRDVYPRMVSARKMRQSIADFHLDRMGAVRETLVFLRDNEATVRMAVASKGGAA